MPYGQALGSIINRQNNTITRISRIALVDNSTLGKYIKGTRRTPKDVMRRLNQELDDPYLMMESGNDVTDDGLVPVLNNIDDTLSTVHIKTVEEMGEAADSLQKLQTIITKKIDQLRETERESIKTEVSEVIEAITAQMHYVAALCRKYDLSWLQLWRDHRRELREKGYLI